MVNNKKDYFIVNLVFLIIIGVVLGYSYFFYPNDQPIQCVYKAYTGKNCSTCGFSRAFSAYTHFNYTEGSYYNQHAFACFLFFLIQFCLRLSILLIYFMNPLRLTRLFMISEITLTVIFFLVAFFPLLMK